MANDSVLEKKSDGTTVPSPPIIVPAHKPLSHTAQEISDRIDAELSRKNLLIAAHGGMSPRAAAIKDYPLSMLPPLDPSSPGYAKDLAARLEYDRRNQENEAKRTAIVLQEFTEVYGFLLAISVEAVELRRELQTTCKDYAGHADCFDGPRAFKMVKHHLLHGTATRSKADKDFYQKAYDLQVASTLPNGCSKKAFTAKAYAWIVHILPNMSTEFKEPCDTWMHIVDMMPEQLRGDGRDLERELKRTGEWDTPRREDGLMYVMNRCAELVEKVQKSDDHVKPAFAAGCPSLGGFKVSKLAAVAGMPKLAGDGMPELLHGDDAVDAAGFAGKIPPGHKFCDKCPHKDKCWRDPSYSGTLPIGLWCNEKERKKIFAEKAANAKKLGVPNKRITAPPKSKIEAYQKKYGKKKEKEKEDGAPAGVFTDGLIDIDDEDFGVGISGCAAGATPLPTAAGDLAGV